MAIEFHPKPGQILLCDFSQGFKTPEMVKSNRPVIVITPALKYRSGLVTVVPLSTVKPEPIMSYHYRVPRNCLPQTRIFQEKDNWVKGDLIYTVGFHRLNLVRLGARDKNTGKRHYFKRRLDDNTMKEIYKCILHGINLGHLSVHL
ncbi:MAG: type II toxin-antitoxin system PemK/MazF family toxin [Gammaproteobacteria bacterium]|nr:type II toxin-antitoxin system PemK/MazF family toxin [Gammaproteobacteria bacterium]